MVRHIAMFQMLPEAQGATGAENAKKIAEGFLRIAKEIPGVVSCEAGFNYKTDEKNFYELCMNSVYESPEALNEYLVHPLHMELREFIFATIDHRMVADYEI